MPNAAETARNRFIKGEIEAGLVFAANALEYQNSDPAIAANFTADAEDCYATALKLLRQSGPVYGGRMELEAMVDELRVQLVMMRGTRFVAAAA